MKKAVFLNIFCTVIFFILWSETGFACDSGFFRHSVVAPLVVLAVPIIGYYLARKFVRKLTRLQVILICLLFVIVGLYFTLPSAFKDLSWKCESLPIDLKSFDP